MRRMLKTPKATRGRQMPSNTSVWLVQRAQYLAQALRLEKDPVGTTLAIQAFGRVFAIEPSATVQQFKYSGSDGGYRAL
ncbi:hypothetical protein LIA77_01448 [Sarocladium implicatum]|nr:hypothetical protein LIA77_01448 [Sarocladium implicatum]